jgi:hypothetical protein
MKAKIVINGIEMLEVEGSKKEIADFKKFVEAEAKKQAKA